MIVSIHILTKIIASFYNNAALKIDIYFLSNIMFNTYKFSLVFLSFPSGFYFHLPYPEFVHGFQILPDPSSPFPHELVASPININYF